MSNKNIINKILAIAGSVLVWLPILAPLLFSIMGLLRAHRLMVDYLMPAELFPMVLVGGLLLLWAALRMQAYRRLIAWAFGAAMGLPWIGQGVASLTGLASGRIEPTGWQWIVVLGFIFAYILAVIILGIGGILLIRQLFRTARQEGNA